ncbi:MAG: hypothetical protein IPM50_11395 [Acidobacteriota bacterium]|nr:MAG: hypothetical protein IPM50_11395 [Acidobacteriota bacterium]
MDLIDDLDNDLVFAFFVERMHSQKIDASEVVALLGKVRTALNFDADRVTRRLDSLNLEHSVRATYH